MLTPSLASVWKCGAVCLLAAASSLSLAAQSEAAALGGKFDIAGKYTQPKSGMALVIDGSLAITENHYVTAYGDDRYAVEFPSQLQWSDEGQYYQASGSFVVGRCEFDAYARFTATTVDGKPGVEGQFLTPHQINSRRCTESGWDTDTFDFVKTVTTPASGGTLIGALNYTGGFVSRVGVAVHDARLVTHFRVDIPQFCKDVEVVEAGTITENIFDAAKESDATSHAYEVNGGRGARIGAIAVSLNGPSGLKCAIPIFVDYAPNPPNE